MNKNTILLISGSIRPESYTRTLVDFIGNELKKKGYNPIHWDLLEKPLPIANPLYHKDQVNYPDEKVIEFVSYAKQASGFVFGTPIYHNSYSGVLKNALDHLSMVHFKNKPVGLVSHGGNRSSQGVDHLRIVTRGLLGIAITTQVCTSKEDYCYNDEEYNVSNSSIIQRTERFVNEMDDFCKVFNK
ncbi:MAG: NADPH-dependent FMN reductase [Saprospiraceae bacterium]